MSLCGTVLLPWYNSLAGRSSECLQVSVTVMLGAASADQSPDT